jgi:hypothetical protein
LIYERIEAAFRSPAPCFEPEVASAPSAGRALVDNGGGACVPIEVSQNEPNLIGKFVSSPLSELPKSFRVGAMKLELVNGEGDDQPQAGHDQKLSHERRYTSCL